MVKEWQLLEAPSVAGHKDTVYAFKSRGFGQVGLVTHKRGIRSSTPLIVYLGFGIQYQF